MKKNTLAFLLGLIVGMRGINKGMHLVYLTIIGELIVRSWRIPWSMTPTAFFALLPIVVGICVVATCVSCR
jgi:hypothetical protein